MQKTQVNYPERETPCYRGRPKTQGEAMTTFFCCAAFHAAQGFDGATLAGDKSVLRSVSRL